MFSNIRSGVELGHRAPRPASSWHVITLTPETIPNQLEEILAGQDLSRYIL